MWIRMFLHEHLWIQLLLALTILPSPLCFSQAQTNKDKHDSSLMCLLWVSVIIYRPSCLWHQFMALFFFFFLQAVWSHIYLPYYDVTPWRVSFLWVCFYLSNTETMNQHYYSMQEMGAKVWQIEVAYPFVMMVTNGSPGHLLCLQWSTTLAEAVMLMMKYTYKYTLACMVCLLLRLFPRLSLRPQRNVFTSAVTCRCGSQNEIQGPFVPISFSYQAKCSLETGLITWHDPQSR